MILPRRKFLTGLAASFLAAPAIVRASSLMAISPVPTDIDSGWWDLSEVSIERVVLEIRNHNVNSKLWSRFNAVEFTRRDSIVIVSADPAIEFRALAS